jgi:hypothetical protein
MTESNISGSMLNSNRKTQDTPKHMYKENAKTINWFVGCQHDCIYCKPSFQRQIKRQGKRCRKCYDYEPHAHLERLWKSPPKTSGKSFIFFPSSGDVTFASKSDFGVAIDYATTYHDATFLIQSKNPSCFLPYKFPENVILGTTAETNLLTFNSEQSKFQFYSDISKAVYPIHRLNALRSLSHKRKFVTIEPILDFSEYFVDLIKTVNPEFVYIGYDNHHCKLPEPKLAETQQLIRELEKFTEVRVKTLRKAWWE